MRAWVQAPQSRDQWQVHVAIDPHPEAHAWYLREDGLWIETPWHVATDPAVVVKGWDLYRNIPEDEVRDLFLPAWLSYGVVAAIEEAGREQACLPAWLRSALAPRVEVLP